MIIIAMTLYLPQHIAFLTNRAWFYYNGDESVKASVDSVFEGAKTSSTVVMERIMETAVGAVPTMVEHGKEL